MVEVAWSGLNLGIRPGLGPQAQGGRRSAGMDGWKERRGRGRGRGRGRAGPTQVLLIGASACAELYKPPGRGVARRSLQKQCPRVCASRAAQPRRPARPPARRSLRATPDPMAFSLVRAARAGRGRAGPLSPPPQLTVRSLSRRPTGPHRRPGERPGRGAGHMPTAVGLVERCGARGGRELPRDSGLWA